MPNDPITLQEMPGIRARTYQDLVRYLMDRAGQAVAPAGMSLFDTLANIGDMAGFGHRANMGLVNTGTESKPLWIPRPGAEFDPSGSALGGSAPIKTEPELELAARVTPRQIAGELRPMPLPVPLMREGQMTKQRAGEIGRRQFLKIAPGGALAAKALLSGGETGIKSQAPRVIEQAAKLAPEAAAVPSPIRLYERVGNKFVLTQEHPNPGPKIESGHSVWETDKDIYPGYLGPPPGYRGNVQLLSPEGKILLERPGNAIRPVEIGTEHPEHKLLIEQGGVYHPLSENFGKHPGDWDLESRQGVGYYGNDPYHARFLDAQGILNALPDSLQARLKDANMHGTPPPNMTPMEKEAWKIFDRGKPITTNTYIIEKPIRVRYIEQGRRNLNRLEQEGELADVQDFGKYEQSIHPEVWKLPLEHRGNIVHETGEVLYDDVAGNAPRLIGSGDTYEEAIDKAYSFLRDIGIDERDVLVRGAKPLKKIIKMELPNGDVIEIRERPSLRPGYTPEKAGYRNKKK